MSERPMSLMMRKMRAQDASEAASKQTPIASDHSSENDKPQYPFRRAYYFFYGTLMDPDTLSQVLKLPRPHIPPVMRRARVVGYEIKLWGPYPALIEKNTSSLQSVNGIAYEILPQTQVDRLAANETGKYCLRSCMIDLLNDDDNVQETIHGLTFLWDGEHGEQRDGTFDLKQWKKKQLRDLD
ncbi:gamma-glutamylcyclotransferase family protein [Aspergillus affinis]|uniref:gamma-glutamylcyclotransferase family protein n=1 Tax=Aspergillus affinis TaxID=1070780 RepID=UPI0022FEE090|nr:gamma-glutamylcyclotransferase domain-containing protein [Aspergillus affinis]KAI9039893.1 AIG2-like [Aspergillus affinis]